MNQCLDLEDRVAARWASVGESIFPEMTKLARHYQAVNLGQGAPDFYGFTQVLEAIAHQVLTCHNQYSPPAGEEALRIEVANLIERSLGIVYNPQTEITITNGASGGIYCALSAFINPGDRVLLIEPAYELYHQVINSVGGVAISVPLHAPDSPAGMANNRQWTIDWDTMEKVAADGFSCFVFNSPHNPTGKVFSAAEMKKMAAYILQNNALVLTDEVYENFLYENAEHLSFANFPELRHLVLRVSSAAKSFGFTGLKIGWICAPEHLTKTIRIVQQSTVFCLSPFTQLGLAEVMKNETLLGNFLAAQKSAYFKKRNFLSAALKKANFEVCDPEGSYFLTASYKNIFGNIHDVQCARKLVECHGLATIPISPFYGKSPENFTWLRFAFCKTDETLAKGAEKLSGIE